MYDKLTNPYQVSRDYQRLHGLLADRNEVVCFVDYRFGSEAEPCRDVCTARCFPDDDYIHIGARGIAYGAFNHLSQVPAFIADCERMNLEFVDPQK